MSNMRCDQCGMMSTDEGNWGSTNRNITPTDFDKYFITKSAVLNSRDVIYMYG